MRMEKNKTKTKQMVGRFFTNQYPKASTQQLYSDSCDVYTLSHRDQALLMPDSFKSIGFIL